MSLARNLATVGAATLVSRLLGFIRDAGVAALLGAGPLADAYVAALQIPNLFRRLLADGALNPAFVPIWLQIRNDAGSEGARRFGAQAMGTMFVALAALTLLCIVFAPAVVTLIAPGFARNADRFDMAVTLLRFAVPYVAVAGVVAVAAAILNGEGRVGAASIGTIAFNCVLVAAIAVIAVLNTGTTRTAAMVLAASFVVAGGVQLIPVVAVLMRLKLNPNRLTLADTPDIRRLYARALPSSVATGMPQLVLMAGAIIASPSPSAVAWLYYANRLYELPLGVISIAITAVLAPRIATQILARNAREIAAAQSRALEVALGIALPAATGLAMLSTLIAGVLFERGAFGPDDTAAVAMALSAIAAGLAGHAIEKVFGAVSFSHGDANTPMLTAMTGLAATLAVAMALFPRYGHVGIAAALAVSGWVSAAALFIVLSQRGWIVVERGTSRRLLGIACSTLAMGCAIALIMALAASQFGVPASFFGRLVWLVFLIGIGLATYLFGLSRFGIADIRALIAAARLQS